MAVDVKVIRVHLWRLSVLFGGICFRFAQKHPCISGALLTLFVLYAFFPLVFRLLIYSSPIMICAYGYRKNVVKSAHLKAGFQKTDDHTNVEKSELILGKKMYENFSIHNGGTEVKEERKETADYIAELHKKPSDVHDDEKLKNAIRESESDILGKAENDIKKDKVEWGKAKNAETEDDDLRKAIVESESDILDKAEDDDETQEEDAQDDMQKGVKWTEQDERNLMDLGTSETERDRRLESLIQRRRARKLLSMQVRNVIDILRHRPNQVAPLVIARGTGPFNLINTLSETDDLNMPGSAPSVLLPSCSPFDLPYDPFEERPNLTGDSSFEQEFVTADQKDFCRHESFLGSHFGPRQDGNSLNSFMNTETKGTERNRFSRFRSYTDRGSHESNYPGASSLEHKLMSYDDIAVRDSGCEEHSLKQSFEYDNATSKDNAEPENNKTEKAESESQNASSCGRSGTVGPVEADSAHSGTSFQKEGAKVESNQNMSSEDLSSYLHKSLGSSTSEIVVKETNENGNAQSRIYISSKDLFNVHKRPFHTPAHSVASDLVVEVSEAGSPPPTLSPPDGDSSQYDEAVDRDLSSESEDMSMHVCRMERSSEGRESIPEVVELEQDVVDGYEHTSSSTDDSSYENVVQHLTEKLTARCLSNKVIMGTPEEPSNPAEKGSGVQIDDILSNQTNPMTGVNGSSERNERYFTTTDQCETSGLSSPDLTEGTAITSEKHLEPETGLGIGTSSSRELDEHDGDSGNPDYGYGMVENVAVPVEEQGSSNLQVAEDVLGDTEMRSSDHVAMPAAQQAQADEVVPEVTSPKSVLPDTDFRDQIARLDSQPSDLADSPSDVTPSENSTPSIADNQSVGQVDNQHSMSSPSESSIEQGNNKNDKADYQTTESEATLNPSTSENNNEASGMVKTDEEVRNVEVKQGILNESHLTDEVTSSLIGTGGTAPVAGVLKETAGAEGNHIELHGDNLVTKVDPVDLGDSLVGITGAEALPLSDNLNADDEFNGLAVKSPEFEGSASASNIDASEGNTPSKQRPRDEASLPDMDTELQIHRITETCM